MCAVAGKEKATKENRAGLTRAFHFILNGFVESLIFLKMAGWLSHCGFSLVCSCWVNVLYIYVVLFVGCTFYILFFGNLHFAQCNIQQLMLMDNH